MEAVNMVIWAVSPWKSDNISDAKSIIQAQIEGIDYSTTSQLLRITNNLIAGHTLSQSLMGLSDVLLSERCE